MTRYITNGDAANEDLVQHQAHPAPLDPERASPMVTAVGVFGASLIAFGCILWVAIQVTPNVVIRILDWVFGS